MGETRTGLRSAISIHQDLTPAAEVRSYWERSFLRRSYNPMESPLATENLRTQVDEWKAQGKTVVFTSGVYDLFHANHRTYLFHTKIAAAPFCWRKFYNHSSAPTWEQLTGAEQSVFTERLLKDDLLRLVVSVDGNLAVAERKGNNPEKGGNERPIYDWDTRSRDVLSAALEVSPGVSSMIADAVTIHDRVEPAFADTPHAGIMEIAEFVRPDVWSVYFESEDIIEAVSTTHANTFSDVGVTVLNGNDFYHDRLLGGPFKTTAIVKRIGGTMLNGNGD